jgi:hypothetical protein
MINTRVVGCLLSLTLALAASAQADEEKSAIRIGMIGLDTSHALNFTDIINNKSANIPELAGMRVVAGYPIGSPDLKSSIDRVPEYTKKLQDGGMEIVDSIPALLAKCDVVMIESVDGRNHLQLSKPVFESGKLVFIDKPLAASLADGIAITELGKKHNVPWFSASALRFTPAIADMAHDPKLGAVVGCQAWSPCHLDPTHPDLFWYGIHGTETLFTVMGPGCVSVSRTTTPDTDHATGVWADGRIGTFYGIRKGKLDFGATAFGTKGVKSAPDAFKGYEPLMAEVGKFFRTGKPPIAPEQTLEILAFMEAADESKRQGGKAVTIESVIETAKARLLQRSE